MYQPSTEVRIGSVPWNPSYKHVRWYADKTAQANGIASFMDASKTIATYTYQRLDGSIDVEGNPEEYYGFNYVMFQNANFGNKWFYAFVTNVSYKNASTVNLKLELDYVQSYMFDYTIKPCFVEREHVNSDGIGEHIKDEGIDPGELKCTYSAIDNDNMDCYMVVASAVEPLKDGTYVNNGGDQYMGVTSGTSLSVFLTVDQFKSFMQALSDNGQQDAVSQVYMCPRAAIPNIVAKSNGWGYWVDASSPTPRTITWDSPRWTVTRRRTTKCTASPSSTRKSRTSQAHRSGFDWSSSERRGSCRCSAPEAATRTRVWHTYRRTTTG